MIGANPKAIIESYQNINDAFPLTDPLPFYSDVVPVTGETIAPQQTHRKQWFPTFPDRTNGSATAATPDLTMIPTSTPPVSEEDGTDNLQPFLWSELVGY